MAKQAKSKSKRTQVKDLNLVHQELTTDEATKVKGGGSSTTTGQVFSWEKVQELRPSSQPQTSSTTLSATKK